MSKLVGRKVRMMPNCLFYDDSGEVSNIMQVTSVSGQKRALPYVNVTDGTAIYPCQPDELRYLNNREVVV